jgi:alkylation response protein AidB-like acyl-CoA dehydrogenase
MRPTAFPMDMTGLDDAEQAMVDTVARWVDVEVRPRVREMEQAGDYPEAFIDQMKQMGMFGLAITDPMVATAVSGRCFARISEEVARGWMSLSGAFGGHSVVSSLLCRFGTDEQRERYLPLMATGEMRATMALTEPDGGSDLQSIRTVARRTTRDGVDGFVINGSKTWITNARRAGVVALLCVTDPAAEPRHRGISILLVEKVPGFTVSRDLPKLGYKGVESCELAFDDCFVPASALLGGDEGRGFAQMMDGLEIGRIQVSGRAIGVARAAFDDALRYAQDRHAFGKPIWQHQSVGNMLAQMATDIVAAQQLNYLAAERYDAGMRADLEAGMAKLFSSEMAARVTLDAVRIHGGHGYSTEFDVERYYRDAPLMIVGEGTNEIQRNVIVRQLVERSR